VIRLANLNAAMCLGALAAIVTVSSYGFSQAPTSKNQTSMTRIPKEDAAAAEAFEAIVPVLRHPRCINCHSKGDAPRQGDDSHPHFMNVRRGSAGEGVPGVKCSACHQDHNLAGADLPPGAPDWRLPSPEMPMIWEGLSDRQLCELFKDPKQNGHHTIEQIVEHMESPLVQWGWNPGEGRNPVRMPRQEFLGDVKLWAAKGSACPDR
jgi:mono/diheme cytochrome c family protein